MNEYAPILLSDVGKRIIKEVEELTPWDRYELMSELGAKYLDSEWGNTYFHDEDDWQETETFNDPVSDVFDQGLETEVLEEMDDDSITEVLVRKNKIPDIIADLTDEQLNSVIRDLSNKNLKRITDAIINRIHE